MPVKYINRLLVSAFKRKEEDKAFRMWLEHFHYFVKRDDFVPFGDFYKGSTKSEPPETQKTAVEIMDDVELIQHSLRGDKNGNL